MAAASAAAAAGTAAAAGAAAQTVKITPLGSHDGEFCALDRALIFEDPDGIRVEVNFVPGKGHFGEKGRLAQDGPGPASDLPRG